MGDGVEFNYSFSYSRRYSLCESEIKWLINGQEIAFFLLLLLLSRLPISFLFFSSFVYTWVMQALVLLVCTKGLITTFLLSLSQNYSLAWRTYYMRWWCFYSFHCLVFFFNINSFNKTCHKVINLVKILFDWNHANTTFINFEDHQPNWCFSWEIFTPNSTLQLTQQALTT